MLSTIHLYKSCINITYKNQATAKHAVHDSFENITNYQLVEMDAMHACYAALLGTCFFFLSEAFNNFLLKLAPLMLMLETFLILMNNVTYLQQLNQ